MVEGKVRLLHLDIEEIGSSGKVQRAWFGQASRALLQEIGDVLAGEGLKEEGILHDPFHGLGAVDFAQGNDLAHMVGWIDAPVLELPVVVVCFGAKRDKAHEDLLVGGLFALSDQLLGMIRVLDVLVPVIGSWMAGDELIVVIDADPVGIGFEGQPCSGMLGGHGVVIGVNGDTKLRRSPHLPYGADVAGMGGKGLEAGFFFFEHFQGFSSGLPMDAHIGNGIEPETRGGIDGLEGGRLEPGKEIFFHISYPIFHTPLLVALANAARGDGEAVVVGEVQVGWVENRGLAKDALEHGGLEVLCRVARYVEHLFRTAEQGLSWLYLLHIMH